MNHAIEQAVKALEAAVTYLEKRGIRHKGTTGRTIILPTLENALTALRALTEPSKTDEEYAARLAHMLFGQGNLITNNTVPELTQAFAAIRAQVIENAMDYHRLAIANFEAIPSSDYVATRISWHKDALHEIRKLKATK